MSIGSVSAGTSVPRPGLFNLIGLAGAGLLVWLLAGQVSEIDPGEVWAAFSTVPISYWALGLAATAASFFSLGWYDVVVHRRLGTGIPAARAATAGMQAIAISQFAGFGLATGSFARWRLLPDLSAAEAVKVTGLVGLTFMAVLTVAAMAALGLGGLTLPEGFSAASTVVIAVVAIGAILLLKFKLFTPGTTGLLVGLVLLDTGFAALSLWVFLPPGSSLFALYAAFVVALWVGILSSAPGGVGAFDLTLILLLPQIEEPGLLAALMCYRICYYGVPALVAFPFLVWPRPAPAMPLRPVRRDDLPAPHPDWGLASSGGRILKAPGTTTGWLALPAPGMLVALGNPSGRADPALLVTSARSLGRLPVFYKIGSRFAAGMRKGGARVLRVAEEAWIDPAAWDEGGSARRQLRRKLSRAASQGVSVNRAASKLPVDQMAAVNAAWVTANGRERGFSMGRFSPELVRQQEVFLAYGPDGLAGFVTFMTGPAGWGLDLMRQVPDAPGGTMHALVAAALSNARKSGVRAVSLAAVPALPGRLGRRLDAPGLAQFKTSFAPEWRPLYAAAPGRLSLAAGLAGIALAVRRPQDNLEHFAFELARASCHPPEPEHMTVKAPHDQSAIGASVDP